MIEQITSKDFWWASILCIIASFLALRPLASFGLLIGAAICLVFYISNCKEEKKYRNVVRTMKRIKGK